MIKDELNPVNLPASCQEVLDNPLFIAKNGTLKIQPNINFDPFYVDCSFPYGSNFAETILNPKMSGYGYTALPNSSNGCQDPGCFQDKVTYNGTTDQIQELIFLSTECQQQIVHNCTVNQVCTNLFFLSTIPSIIYFS